VVPLVVVYQSAVRDGDRVFTSGQLPMKDGQLMTPGKLGGAVSEKEGYAAARPQTRQPQHRTYPFRAIRRMSHQVVFR
jgi:enamine deaminase RidA (YjgF/YER057c/UK114 family)